MSLLEEAGITQEDMDNATGEVTGEYKPLESGLYKGTVKNVLMYTDNFKNKCMKYIIHLDDHKTDVSYYRDISSMMAKGTKKNPGYVERLKQLLYAVNVDQADCSWEDKGDTVSSYGKTFKAKTLVGVAGKPLVVDVKLMDDISRPDGMSFKYINAISGMLAVDGTDISGESKVESIKEKYEKAPIVKFDGKWKNANNTATADNTTAASTETTAAEAEASGF
jgi:hypothetical protein